MSDKKRFWNIVASFYTLMQERKNSSLYDALNMYALQYVNNTKEVLEVGCGTGQMTKALAEASKSYIATDYSSRMIKRASKRKIANAQFQAMDALALDFADSSFDVVVCANTLHVIKDSEKALNEIYRVLRPGGLLIAPTFIYEGKIHKVKLFILKVLGFKTYHKWEAKDFLSFIRAHGFNVIDKKPINASPTMNLFLVGKK